MTGASRGIGAAVVRQVLQKGGRVVAVGRDQDALVDVAREAPDRVTVAVGDLAEPRQPLLDGVHVPGRDAHPPSMADAGAAEPALRSPGGTAALAVADQGVASGRMFLLWWKALSGSYVALTPASRR